MSHGGVVGTGETVGIHHLQDLVKASLHQLASVHTVVLPSKVNGGGRVIHVAEISLDNGQVTIIGDSGVRLVVNQNGLIEQKGKRDVTLVSWHTSSNHSSRKRQNDNSTLLVYASTFVSFDGNF
jgi:hypothetical protein